MRKRGPKPKGKVKIKWSSNFAYAIGLIVSDGNLSPDGRHLNFTSKDIEQIDNYQKALNIKCHIGKKSSGLQKEKKYFVVQFGDVSFYNFLVLIGITSAKSRTIGKIKIQDKYFFDFLRGYFDGDGCSYSYWDPRWKSSFMFYIGFVSGSIIFIKWLRLEINKKSKLCGHLSIHKKKEGGNNYYQLRYSKYEAIKLSSLMYKNEDGLKLKRKYLKIMKSLCIVKEHKGKVFVK